MEKMGMMCRHRALFYTYQLLRGLTKHEHGVDSCFLESAFGPNFGMWS